MFSLAQAQVITYVDVVSGILGNTFATGSTQDDTSWLGAADSAAVNNGLWAERSAGNGTSSNVFQANVS